jgi:hypothetical protein
VSNPWDEFAALSADVQALLEWEHALGSSVLPFESIPRTERPRPVPIRPQSPSSVRTPQRAAAVAPRPVETTAPVIKAKEVPVEQKADVPVAVDSADTTAASAALSSSWDSYMSGGTAYKMVGPLNAPLMIVRGVGSSTEAESMLDRMIENVIKLDKNRVAVVDLVRDSRSAQVIGDELRRDLVNLRPSLILIMGTFSAQAVLGGEGIIEDARGQWLQVEWTGGGAAARVTHHPEALLAMAARGQHGAKRETFTDLQEVAERIS